MQPHEMIKSLIDSGINQKEIERRTGINQPTISRIYNKLNSPAYETFKAIEALYNQEVANKSKAS